MMELRVYQSDIIRAVGTSNAIIKMPTGSGKTLVAAELVRLFLFQVARRSMALFLVPTVDLVEQQSLVLGSWIPNAVHHKFHGSLSAPNLLSSRPQTLVSTPQAFRSLQVRNPVDYSWSSIGFVVFDEVHHVLKDHPYRNIALNLQQVEQPLQPQIVGMSASLTYSVTDSGVESTLNRLCRELKVDKLISPSLAELAAGGYVAQHGNNVEVESCMDVPEGVVPEELRKPHLLYATFRKRLSDGSSTPFAKKVLSVVSALEKKAMTEDPSFKSPLDKSKLSSWEEYAFQFHKKISSANKRNRQGTSVFECLEYWYTAVRLLVQSWEEDEHLVLQWLDMNKAIETAMQIAPTDSSPLTELAKLGKGDSTSFKTDRLLYHLIEKREKYGNSFRCIIFVETRIKAVVISNWIQNHPILRRLTLESDFITSREAKITPRLKVSKSGAGKVVRKFQEGNVNVLVATSVIEEGFDVPAANVVISYDPLKNSVELCQRFGRARQLESSIVVLDEREDRPFEQLEAIRKHQDDTISSFQPGNHTYNDEQETQKQKSRELNAYRQVLDSKISKTTGSPLLSLNMLAQKTKASIEEKWESKGNLHVCILSYKSLIRASQSKAEGSSRKEAKRTAATALLDILEKQMRPTS